MVGLFVWWFLVWQPFFAGEPEGGVEKFCGSEKLGEMYAKFSTKIAIFVEKYLDINVMAFLKVSPKLSPLHPGRSQMCLSCPLILNSRASVLPRRFSSGIQRRMRTRLIRS